MPAVVPILVGAVAAGTTISAVGQIKAGNAATRAGASQRALAELEAGNSDFNASVAELQADDAIARGELETSRFRTQVRSLIGRQRAGFAGQNIVVGSGSAADVQADTAYLGELDAQQLHANAVKEAYGYRVEAENLRSQAAAQRAGGAIAYQAGLNARTASRYGAATTILGGTSNLLAAKYGWGS